MSRTVLLACRFASRELRGGIRGFAIFIACIALGVAAIAAVGSVAHTMRDTIAAEGREILGADISFSLVQRQANTSERAWIGSLGTHAEVATLRALARRDSPAGNGGATENQTLVEVKAIDAAYPLYGVVAVAGAGPDWLAALARRSDGSFGGVMERALSERLGVRVGDTISLGLSRITLVGVLTTEPDKLGSGVGFGPRLMIGRDGLEATGLVQPGSLIRWTYRVKLPQAENSASRLAEIKDEAVKRFPEAGWEIRTRLEASPGLVRNIENFASFLTLVGLTALIVGGVGVANAVRSFVDAKREVIAIFKSLGASGNLVFLIYAIQVAAVALLGIAIGLVAGVVLTEIAAWFLKDLLPVDAANVIHIQDLALAAVYGLLTAASFALWPLGRTHDMRPSALFRDGVAPAKAWPRLGYILATGMAGLLLVALAVGLAPDRKLAAGYLAAFLGVFLVLRLVSAGVGWLARRLPRLPTTELRLAVANLHRPGAATTSVLLSLGLGLTLLVSLGQIDSNLRGQLGAQLPKSVPSFFFLDVMAADLDGFSRVVGETAPSAMFERMPMLRGRIASIGGVRAEQLKPNPRSAFILQGDRGMTFDDELPKNSTLTAGTWWPKDYAGPPLVSMEADLGQDLGLKVGDKLKVNVLGRDIEVTVGNFRKVAWTSFGINFFMVFSPNTFKGAPIGYIATVAFPGGTPEAREFDLLGKVTAAFPTVTAIRVKDQLKSATDLIAQLATGVAAAASVAILTAILVLAGAFAASQERRIYVAVILKTLGASRTRILVALTLEFIALGFIAGVVALLAGCLAAWVVISQVMGLVFTLSIGVAAIALTSALVVTLIIGLANTWVALGQKAAPMLRSR